MTPDEIKKAIEIVKSVLPHIEGERDVGNFIKFKVQVEAIEALLDLATQVVEAKMPQFDEKEFDRKAKLGDDFCSTCHKWYKEQIKSALSDYRLYLINRLAGLEEMIQSAIMAYNVNEASISVQYLKENPKCLMNYLAQAIRNLFGGGKNVL